MKLSEQVCQLYLDGKTNEEIAELVGCHISTVNKYLRKRGITKKKRIADALPLIFKLRHEGKTLKEISDATGFHQCKISDELNKHGLGYRQCDIDISGREIDESTLTYANRKPKVFKVEYDGKKYVDITDLCGI